MSQIYKVQENDAPKNTLWHLDPWSPLDKLQVSTALMSRNLVKEVFTTCSYGNQYYPSKSRLAKVSLLQITPDYMQKVNKMAPLKNDKEKSHLQFF